MTRSDQAALIMSGTGETMSYAAYKARTNRLAHLLRAKGLNREDITRFSWKTMHAMSRPRRDGRSRSLFSAHHIRLSVKPREGAFPMFLPGNMSMSPLRMR
jgi:hypothetical protein